MGEIELGAAAEATVQAYKELAFDPSQTLILAKDDTCIQFLAYVTAEGSGTLLQAAVDTLDLITTNIDCRPFLARTFGVFEALQELADDERYSEELRNQAAGIFTSLKFSCLNKNKILDNGKKNISDNEEDKSEKNVDQQATARVKWKKNKREKKKKEHKFMGPHNNKAKSVTIYIKGMTTQEHRKTIERELIRVKGLISIVFDLTKSRATCRLRKDLKVDKLAEAVALTGEFDAVQLIVINGIEKMIKIGGVNLDESVAVQEDLPEYLHEDESPMRNRTSAMAPSGALREAASTFISAAANLLSNSFYW